VDFASNPDSDADSPALSSELRAFLEEDAHAEQGSADPLAERDLYAEWQGKGATPRLLLTGGVTYVRSTHHTLTPADLPPMTRRRTDLDELRLELVKFEFMIRELPENRRYKEVRVLIKLDPYAPIMFMRPKEKSADSESVKTFSSQFAPTLAKLLQFDVSLAKTGSVSRTEQHSVVNCVSLGPEGFGWTFRAQEGTPLLPGPQHTLAVFELPLTAKRIKGSFDAEAMVSRELLGKSISTQSLPQDPAVPFKLRLRNGSGPDSGR